MKTNREKIDEFRASLADGLTAEERAQANLAEDARVNAIIAEARDCTLTLTLTEMGYVCGALEFILDKTKIDEEHADAFLAIIAKIKAALPNRNRDVR